MTTYRKPWFVPVIFFGILIFVLLAPATAGLGKEGAPQDLAQGSCSVLTDPREMPAYGLIDFDTIPNATTITSTYLYSHGVTFSESRVSRVITYSDLTNSVSSPNIAINDAVFPSTSNNIPLAISFNSPKTHVSFWFGNGETEPISASVIAYDVNNVPVCEIVGVQVPEPLTAFVGMYDPLGRIVRVTLDYGDTSLSETIDDLYFSPGPGREPYRTPVPKWTPLPSPTPLPGPSPTATPVLPLYAYQLPVKYVKIPFIPTSDLSIHGIEITQGIQCFDSSKGLTGCGANSLSMVAQKDTTARIYLKYALSGSSMNNVPVRLFIRANNTWYTANATARATNGIDQSASDSADLYFNVNFPNDTIVDFYAIVDPDNIIPETNEGNNRFPVANNTYITLNFKKRDTLKIIGQRIRYHPSGYTGAQYAGGWAVNGGASDWFEQLLPIKNNGVQYSVKSGYLDWTSSLTPCSSNAGGDNQHALIQVLNLNWMLENTLSWLFGTGAFTGADHVYGWVPDAGYPCGHADMPVYPHAGGLGVVGIGTDAPGTSTDAPGAGALIFGHELVHDYDVKHTNTADACGSNDSSSTFPYSSSSIQEFGFNPYTGTIYNPSNTHDLLSYCPSGGSRNGWISPFTWGRMFNELTPNTAVSDLREGPDAGPGVFALTGSQESLVINATIFNPKYAPQAPGLLGELYRISGGLAYNLQNGSKYTIQMLNIYDEVLASYSFDVNFESEYDGHTGGEEAPATAPPFKSAEAIQEGISFVVPWVDGTASITLSDADGLIDVQKVSNHPPKVNITNPTTLVSWPAGTNQLLTWTGTDADDDALTYSVLFSSDAGVSWELVANGLTATQYLVNVDSMAGGNDGRFRVVATDGINIGFDETNEAITIPNHLPIATILSPGPQQVFKPGALVVLQGTGTDMEDGSLADDKLAWSSDVQGSLGIGPSLPIVSLVDGWHVITLTVTDSYGYTSSAKVTILVGHKVYQPVIIR